MCRSLQGRRQLHDMGQSGHGIQAGPWERCCVHMQVSDFIFYCSGSNSSYCLLDVIDLFGLKLAGQAQLLSSRNRMVLYRPDTSKPRCRCGVQGPYVLQEHPHPRKMMGRMSLLRYVVLNIRIKHLFAWVPCSWYVYAWYRTWMYCLLCHCKWESCSHSFFSMS